jgi:hypothetical protein
MCVYIYIYIYMYIHIGKQSLSHREDSKSTLRTIPSFKFMKYLVLSSSCIYQWIYITNSHIHVDNWIALIISCIAGFGPILIAILMSGRSKNVIDCDSANVIHILIGNLFTSLPISLMCYLSIYSDKNLL